MVLDSMQLKFDVQITSELVFLPFDNRDAYSLQEYFRKRGLELQGDWG